MYRARHIVGSLALALACISVGEPSLAQTVSHNESVVGLAVQAEGRPIAQVDVVLSRSSGNTSRDEAIVARLKTLLAPMQGQAFSRALVESSLGGARSRIGAGQIGYRVLDAPTVGSVVLRIEVDTSLDAAGAEANRLMFPNLYRDDRSYLTAILGGGFGVYSDGNAWFGRPDLFTEGNPLAGNLPGRRASWGESYIEAGLGGATQLSDNAWYAFSALTGVTSWSLGQDIFRDDTRTFSSVEKAYAGLLYVDPGTGNKFSISAGRQNVTLNDGFLIHFVRGSANIGERGGTYLGPRNANEFSVDTDLTLGAWSFKGFYIDPDELPLVDGKSTFAGLNIRYAFSPDFSADASYITIPESDSFYSIPGDGRLPREGLRTLAVHVNWKRPLGMDGVWLESEFAQQSHEQFSMSARAGYALVGYHFTELPWSPSVSYRYAHASGDDPNTSRYERYDPMLSTGLGNWLQGTNFGKITSNSNLAVHRVQLNVAPRQELNLTLDWHGLRASELNNLGGNPALSQMTSSDIGNEITATARWAISRSWYFQGVASYAEPGKALRNIGADDAWTTLQANLYWTF